MMNETEAATFLYKSIMDFWLLPSMAAATALKVPDAIAAGAQTARQIADATGTDVDYLRRLLNALAAREIFKRRGEDGYELTAVSALLCSDHPAALGHLLNTSMYGEILAAWTSFGEALQSGRCAFDIRHGMNNFEYLRDKPERRQIFAAGMTATTRAAAEAIAGEYDFGRFELAVDIGGSHASLIGRLLEHYPDARGVVFDLPETVEDGRRLWRDKAFAPRLAAVGGNFFEAVPAGDLYLLKLVLHDWPDADCIKILKSIRKAIRPDGRVAIIETVLPEDASPHAGWGLDIAMMVVTGGSERTLKQHRALLAAAGFALKSCRSTSSIYSVVEAVAIG